MKENRFKKFWTKVNSFVDKILFPDDIKCLFCGKDVSDFENKPYCDECEKEIEFNKGNRCIICDEPIDNEAIVCDNCQKNKRFFKRAFCPFLYSGKVRTAILGYKDSNQRYKAKTFAKYIANRIQESGVEIDCVTYVPLTKKKLRERSFNQAELLAKEIAKILNIEVLSIFEKTKDVYGQKFSNFKERQANMKDLYKLISTKLDKEKNYLIVDDIITTGATVNYCAGLIEKKVKNVYVCAIARNKRRHKFSQEESASYNRFENQ